MGVTAKARSGTSLSGTTTLTPDEVVGLVKEIAGAKLGGGASLLTTGAANIGANVNIVREAGSKLTLSLTSGKKLVELCTFPMSADAGPDGGTKLSIGGLATYKTSQEKLLMVIPIGPKQILGMAPYKKFLKRVDEAIRQKDPAASLTISQES